MIKPCPNCNKDIKWFPNEEKRGRKHKFCSLKCNFDYTHINLVCKECNNNFTITKSRYNWATKNGYIPHCSKKCGNLARDKALEKQRKHGPFLERECKYCNIKFFILESAFNRKDGITKGIFCSKKCQFELKKDKNTKIVNCQFCNKEFRASNSRISRGSAKHCSTNCANQNRPEVEKTAVLQRVKCNKCNVDFLIKINIKNWLGICWVCQPREIITEKKCSGCNKIYPVSNFELSRKCPDGYQNRCITCGRRKLLQQYNLSLDDYDDLYEQQNGLCAICNKPSTIKKSTDTLPPKLSVDHCHSTGKVRGLLCSHCNLGLGNFKDDINLLESAINYLKNNQI